MKTQTGNGFDGVTIGNNVVSIGGVSCDVTAATATSVICTVGKSPGGDKQPVEVSVVGKGS